MKNIANMTLNEMVDAGMTAEQINAAIKERIATKEKAMKAKQIAEAAEKARQEEIAAARRQFKKAYAKYMTAVTGEEVPESEMQSFVNEVMIPIEETWNRLKNIKNNNRKLTVKTDADMEELAEGIAAALKGGII